MSRLPGMPHVDTYRLITADPAWAYAYGGAGSAEEHYDGMPLEDICAMRVGDLAHPDGAVLGIWCTGPLAAEGAHLEVGRAWGFTPSTLAFDWLKCCETCSGCGHPFDEHEPREPWEARGRCSRLDRRFKVPRPCACLCFGVQPLPGTGSYTMQGHEHLWLFRRGGGFSDARAVRNVRNTIIAPITRHSAKPEAAQDLLQRLWPDLAPRLELFARRRRDGWACFGNQLPDSDLVFGAEVGLHFPTTPRPVRHVARPEAEASLFDEVNP